MTTTLSPQPSLLTKSGEIVELELLPISADDAGILLPQVRAVLAQVRRFEGYLAEVVKSEMVARGQRERRAGDAVYELKAEAEWIIDSPDAMADVLAVAQATGDITGDERQKAHQVVVSHRFNQTQLNVLAKRVPEIDTLRKRIESEPRLRVKS